MATTGNGDDKRVPAGSPARPAADTPSKLVVRTHESGSGESGVMGAADTAVALAVSGTGETHAHTEPEVREEPRPEMTSGEDLIGTTLLGRYNVTRKIGQGGMGAVYEATHALIGKRVAIKVLLDKYVKKDQIVARLEQEARLASAIGHEHIIDITDFGQTADGRTFVVMEFLEGESLAECLAREGTLPEPRILQIAHQIASALGAAHVKGIIHRDVKPENVFLLKRKDKDFVKVVDFGISKSLRQTDGAADSPRLTQTGMVLGTPLYMSPEQARGDEALDHRIDVYALGVIMYELATGQVPFIGNNYLSVISQVLNDDPKPPRAIRPELSEEFEAIVLRALEKDREKRYQSTDEMIADLNTLLDDPLRSTQRPRITAPRRLKPRGSATRALAWVVGVSVVVAAVAVTVSMSMGGSKAAKPPAAPDARVAAAIPVDAAPPPPDAKPAAKQIEIWIDTTPRSQIYEHATGRNIGRTPVAYPIAEDSPPVQLEAEAMVDGYETLVFEVDPAADRVHDQKNPMRQKLVKAKGATNGGGGHKPPHGNGSGSSKGSGTGTGTASPPPAQCPDGLPPNPVTHKCAGAS